MAEHYVVVVRANLVEAIERREGEPEGPIPETPLAVSTELAANHRRNATLDGRYLFASAQNARVFAALCLDFTRAVAERRREAVDRLPAGVAEWRAPEGESAPGA